MGELPLPPPEKRRLDKTLRPGLYRSGRPELDAHHAPYVARGVTIEHMANDADADHEPSAVVRSVTVEQIAGDADAPEPSNVE